MVRSISSSNFQLEVQTKFQYTDRMKNKARIKEIQKLIKSLNEEKKSLMADDRKYVITEHFGRDLKVGDKLVKTANMRTEPIILSNGSVLEPTKFYLVHEIDYNCDNSISVYTNGNKLDPTCFNKTDMEYFKLALA